MPCARRRSSSLESFSTKYINEGCKVEKKARGSFFEVSEMRSPGTCPGQHNNFSQIILIKFPGIVDIEGLGQNEVNAESKSRLHDKKIKLASEKM